MPSNDRLTITLLILAALLLTTPLYAHAILPIDEPKSSQLLAARQLGEDFDGEAVNASSDLVDTWQEAYVLDLADAREDVDENRTSLLACTDAPGGALDVLDRAVSERTASAEEDAVRSTLRCFDEQYLFLAVPDDDGSAYHRFSLRETDGTTSVATSTVEKAAVASTIRDRELVDYEDLSESERRTVDGVLDSEDSEYGGYQPGPDSSVLDRVPMLLRKEGTTYVIELYGWVDGSNLVRNAVLGTLVTLGLAALVGAAAILRSRRGGGDGPT